MGLTFPIHQLFDGPWQRHTDRNATTPTIEMIVDRGKEFDDIEPGRVGISCP